jgi:hypothetical protein
MPARKAKKHLAPGKPSKKRPSTKHSCKTSKPASHTMQACTPTTITSKQKQSPVTLPVAAIAPTLNDTNHCSGNYGKEDLFALTLEFKLNARNMSCNNRDNTRWLLEEGYTEEEITVELKHCFKKCFSYLLTKFINSNLTPEEEQPWHHNWIHKLDVTLDLQNFFPIQY